MEAILIIMIVVLLILGGVYLLMARRMHTLASHQAVLNIQTAGVQAHTPSAGTLSREVAAKPTPPVALTVGASEVDDGSKSTPPASEPPTSAPDDPAPEASASVARSSPTLQGHDRRFRIFFPNNNVAEAVRVRPNADPKSVVALLGIKQAAPTIFVTGGASYMNEEDIRRTRSIIESLVQFAHNEGAIIVDGGTESGVMQMVGDARSQHGYQFPLIGVSPLGKISYPGHDNPQAEGHLEDSHSHFVLVDGDDWGAESEMIVGLTKAVSGQGLYPAIGVLINGGKIARQEVYLAVAKEIPMLILEGSGRLADEIATAFKTGKASQRILQAILAGGDIQLIATEEGPDAMREKLVKRFARR